MNLAATIAADLNTLGLEARDFYQTGSDLVLRVQPSALMIQEQIWAWLEENAQVRHWWESPRVGALARLGRAKKAEKMLTELQAKIEAEAAWRLTKAEAIVRQALQDAEVEGHFCYEIKLIDSDLPAITAALGEVRTTVAALATI